jgi:hypothetical protein
MTNFNRTDDPMYEKVQYVYRTSNNEANEIYDAANITFASIMWV